MKNMKFLFILLLACPQIKAAALENDFVLNCLISMKASKALNTLNHSGSYEKKSATALSADQQLLQKIQDALGSQSNIAAQIAHMEETYKSTQDRGAKQDLALKLGTLKEQSKQNKADFIKNFEDYIAQYGSYTEVASGFKVAGVNFIPTGRTDRAITSKDDQNAPIKIDQQLDKILQQAIINFASELDTMKISLGEKKYQASLAEVKNYIKHASDFVDEEKPAAPADKTPQQNKPAAPQPEPAAPIISKPTPAKPAAPAMPVTVAQPTPAVPVATSNDNADKSVQTALNQDQMYRKQMEDAKESYAFNHNRGNSATKDLNNKTQAAALQSFKDAVSGYINNLGQYYKDPKETFGYHHITSKNDRSELIQGKNDLDKLLQSIKDDKPFGESNTLESIEVPLNFYDGIKTESINVSLKDIQTFINRG